MLFTTDEIMACCLSGELDGLRHNVRAFIIIILLLLLLQASYIITFAIIQYDTTFLVT